MGYVIVSWRVVNDQPIMALPNVSPPCKTPPRFWWKKKHRWLLEKRESVSRHSMDGIFTYILCVNLYGKCRYIYDTLSIWGSEMHQIHPLKFNSLPLRNGGWKTWFCWFFCLEFLFATSICSGIFFSHWDIFRIHTCISSMMYWCTKYI